MKKIIMSVLLIAVVAIFQNSNISAKQLERPMKISEIFKDKNLAEYFANHNGKSVNDIMNQEEVDEIESFYIQGEYGSETSLGKQVVKLDGIEYFNNILDFSILNTSISDLTPIANLKKMQSIYFHASPIKNISALSNITSLHDINFYDIPLSDITPLKNSVILQHATFHRTGITDLSPLSIHANNEEFSLHVGESNAVKLIDKPTNNILTINNPFIGLDKKPILLYKVGSGGVLNDTNNSITWNNFNNSSNSYSLSAHYQKNDEGSANYTIDGTVRYKFNNSTPNEKPEDVYSTIKKGKTTYYYMRMGKEYFNYKNIYQSGQRKIITTNSFIKNKCKTTRTPNSCGVMIKKLDYTKKVVRNGQYYVRNNKGIATQYKEVIKNSHNKTTKVKTSKSYKGKLVRDREQRYSYYKNKKIRVYVTYRYKNNKLVDRREYRYNKKSQLKSNKKGKAYYYRTSYKKGKATKTIKANYTKNGGKVKYHTVKVRR